MTSKALATSRACLGSPDHQQDAAATSGSAEHNTRLRFFGTLGAGLALATVAVAASPTPTDQIKLRQANYKSIGRAFKGMKDELDKAEPSKILLKKYADDLNALAPHVNEWFPPGTAPEAGVKTQAKPEIWTHRAEFLERARAFAAASARLNQVIGTGDIPAIKAQFKATGETCAACHKEFRAKDNG